MRAKRAIRLVGLYLGCWVVAHCALFLSRGEGLGLDVLPNYFFWAWSFSGGELPSLVLLGSFVLFGIVLLLFGFGTSFARFAKRPGA